MSHSGLFQKLIISISPDACLHFLKPEPCPLQGATDLEGALAKRYIKPPGPRGLSRPRLRHIPSLLLNSIMAALLGSPSRRKEITSLDQLSVLSKSSTLASPNGGVFRQ